MDRIDEFLRGREENNLLRGISAADFRKEGKIYFGGREYIDFSSNDYLGLACHPRVLDAAKKAIDQLGASASASRLLSGSLKLHHFLEEKTAALKGKEKALIYNSGYQANTGIISALYRKGDAVFSDRLNHASITDGILLSGARMFRFRHNDMEHLERLLKEQRKKYKQALIVTETVFSMDGDKSPLCRITELKERYNCRLLVDEAHATGIFGKDGSGLVEESGLQGEVDLVMGTFSKALGSFGAYIAGEKKIIEYLINASRAFIYSTALPPGVVAASLAALKLLESEPFRRETLLENAQFFRSRLEKSGLKTGGSSQIIPLIVGDTKKTLELSRRLRDKGYWAVAIRPPTVPQGQARVRFSLSYCHSRKMLERLAEVLAGEAYG